MKNVLSINLGSETGCSCACIEKIASDTNSLFVNVYYGGSCVFNIDDMLTPTYSNGCYTVEIPSSYFSSDGNFALSIQGETYIDDGTVSRDYYDIIFTCENIDTASEITLSKTSNTTYKLGSLVKAIEPCDYVIEQGTDGIWTYRKWNSGMAECWGVTPENSVAITSTWGNIYVKDEAITSQKFPFTFIDVPVLQVAPRIINGNFWIYTYGKITASETGNWSVARGSANNNLVVSASFYVIGKWK